MTHSNRIATGVMLLGEGAGIFAIFCPSLFTVASPTFADEEAAAGYQRRMHIGEGLATALIIARGATISGRRGDPGPIIAAVLISAVFIATYEHLTRNPIQDA